jgi:transcriptional regulator with XRE-family HTH domain
LDLALRLKLFRVSADLRQNEVAEALNVTTNFVSMIERGKREPTLKYLRAFAKLIKVPVSVLLWEPAKPGSKDQDVHAKLSALMAQYAQSIGVRSA